MRAEFKKFQKRKEVLEFLSEFGITEEMLKKLPSLFEEKPHNETRSTPTDEEAKKIKEKYTNVPTMEQLVKQFSGDVEEFYINGKPKSDA